MYITYKRLGTSVAGEVVWLWGLKVGLARVVMVVYLVDAYFLWVDLAGL